MIRDHENPEPNNYGHQLNGLMFLETLKENLPHMTPEHLDGLADLLDSMEMSKQGQEDRISAIRELATRLRDCGFSCAAEWEANQN